MIIKQIDLNLFHKFRVIIVELGFLSFKVSIVGKLSKIDVFSGETFVIGEALIKVSDLVDLLNLFCEFGEGLFHLIFSFNEVHEGLLAHWVLKGFKK